MKKLIFLLVLGLLFLFSPVSAIINVTYSDVGTTYINWTWNSGLNVTDIFLDGKQQCGYETTSPSLLQSGLEPNSTHTILVVTETDTGSNTTSTYPAEPSAGMATPDLTYAIVGGIIGSMLIFILFIRRKKQ